MRAKFLFLLLSLGLGIASCSKKSSSPSLDGQPGNGACDQLNLVRDASWTSGFVKTFVSCLSEGSATSRQRFALTLDVLDRLGEQSLQSALDLFRFERNGQLVFFGLTSSLLDRGALDQGADRWLATQAVLEDTKPFAFATLLMELKRRDLLTPLLDTLQSADDTLPKGFIEASIRQFLSDDSVKADALVLIKAFLADEDAFILFNQFLTPERQALEPDCKASTCSYPGSAELKSSAQHWLDFWNTLPAVRRDRLALSMAQLMKGTLEQGDAVAMDRGQRLSTLAIETILRSSNVYQQLYEALDVMLETPLSSYEPFIQGLNRIKDNPIYLDAFQEKIGSSQLQDLVLEFLWKGGQPKACSAMIPGLATAADAAERGVRMRQLLNASVACGGKAPVLVMISEYLGYECSSTSCNVALFSDNDPAELNALLRYHFAKTADDLAHDGFELYRMGAAHGELSLDVWRQLETKSKAIDFKDIAQVLAFEKTMALAYPRLLASDWLELSLNQTLRRLSTLEQSFKGLYPDRDPIEQWYYSAASGSGSEADTQLARIVFGLYEGGSANQLLNEAFRLDVAEKDWRAAHPNSRIARRDLAQLIAPLRSTAALFRNPSASFKPEAEKIALPWLGSAKNGLSFSSAGRKESQGDALKEDLLFDESENGLSFQSRYTEQLALATASIPADEADEFRSWMVKTWIPSRLKMLNTLPLATQDLALELFDRSTLSAVEARMMVFFLGTQFTEELREIPQNAVVSSGPVSNFNPKAEAARALFGPSALGGSERPWTSFWLFQNSVLEEAHASFASMRSSLAKNPTQIQESLSSKVTQPTLVSQGLLDVADANKLTDHEKILLQLHLLSPIFENRGKQFFVPAVGFASYCPKKVGEIWTASACPFSFPSADAYAKFLDTRFTQAFCGVLPKDGEALAQVLSAMKLAENATEMTRLCASAAKPKTWRSDRLQKTLMDALAFGKNPKLKSGIKSLPTAIRWAKSQQRTDPKEQLKAFLSHTPILDGLSSAKVEQRLGIYQSFFSRNPGAPSVWLLYLSRDIGLRGLTEGLKKLGTDPIGGSEKPVEDFLGLIASQYELAKSQNSSTLEFAFQLLTEISRNTYARETVMRILGKPYDPYAGVLMGYTLPQAVKAGILPDFDWATYAPLRLLLQNQNLDLLQGFAEIYDRDALDWLDSWLKITAQFPSLRDLADDARPMLGWLRAFAESRDSKTAEDLVQLASLRDWQSSIASMTRLYRLLRVSLPDLSNQWHPAFYFESEALAKTLVETLPRLLALKDRFELEGGDKTLMADAFLGLIQGPLRSDSRELSLWLQDERMGFRAPSFWGAALRDKTFRSQLHLALTGFDKTTREDWRKLRAEWDTLAPNASRLINYTASNVVILNEKARYQKDALTSLGRVTIDNERWAQLGLTLDAWLDDASPLEKWQDEFKADRGN